MKIIITAESTIDCPQELLNQYNIKTVPFTIILGEKEYFDATNKRFHAHERKIKKYAMSNF